MPSRRAAGFTLIELAVVIAIIGLLVAGAFTSFSAVRINTKLRETNQSLHVIEQLVQAFVARHGRLPCPAQPNLSPSDAGYGQEYNSGGYGSLAADGGGGGCNAALQIGTSRVYRGTLPAFAFGRRVSMITDGWDTQFHYIVVGEAARADSVTNRLWARNNDVEDEIELWDKAAADGSAPAPRQIVNLGVVAVISAGPNRNGGFTIDGQQLPTPPAGALGEHDNLDVDDVYLVSTDYSEDADAPFDDMVRVWTEDDLLLPLALAGELKSKQALTLERMRRMVDVVYAAAAADAVDPNGAGDVPGSSNYRTRRRALPNCDEDEDGVAEPSSFGECRFPYVDFGMSLAEAQDAWGTVLYYLPNADAADHTTPEDEAGLYLGGPLDADDIVFTLRSAGPDRNIATAADNLVIQHTKAEMVGRLLNAGVTFDDDPDL